MPYPPPVLSLGDPLLQPETIIFSSLSPCHGRGVARPREYSSTFVKQMRTGLASEEPS